MPETQKGTCWSFSSGASVGIGAGFSSGTAKERDSASRPQDHERPAKKRAQGMKRLSGNVRKRRVVWSNPRAVLRGHT